MSDTWAQRAPLFGIVAIVLIVAGFLISGETPGVHDSAKELTDFYGDDKQMIASSLIALGAIAFVFFAATLRSALRAAESLSMLTLIGGAVFATGLAIFSGINFTAADLANTDKISQVDFGALQALNALNEDLFFPAMIGGAVLYFSTGLATLATGALPRWLGWVSIALGVLAIAGPAGFFAFLLLAPWTLAVSIVLLSKGGSASGSAYQENPVGTS